MYLCVVYFIAQKEIRKAMVIPNALNAFLNKNKFVSDRYVVVDIVRKIEKLITLRDIKHTFKAMTA